MYSLTDTGIVPKFKIVAQRGSDENEPAELYDVGFDDIVTDLCIIERDRAEHEVYWYSDAKRNCGPCKHRNLHAWLNIQPDELVETKAVETTPPVCKKGYANRILFDELKYGVDINRSPAARSIMVEQSLDDFQKVYSEDIGQKLRSKIQSMKENAQESETVETLDTITKKMDDLGI